MVPSLGSCTWIQPRVCFERHRCTSLEAGKEKSTCSPEQENRLQLNCDPSSEDTVDATTESKPTTNHQNILSCLNSSHHPISHGLFITSKLSLPLG